MIKICLFNKFTIDIDGVVYDMYEELGNQLSEVMATIIYYHKGGMSKQMLIDLFWGESEKPENALKYSIFRLREKLSKIDGFKDFDWIVTKKNGYNLNDELEYIFDIDEFNKVVASGNHSTDDVDKLIELYNGGFLISNTRLYTYNIRMFYEDLFINFIQKSAMDYFRKEKYEVVLDIMEKSFVVVPLNEELIYIYLKTLIKTKRYNAALKYYQKLSKEFLSTYNKPLSEKIDNLFHAYLDSKDNSIEDIDDVVKLLKFTEESEGPMNVNFLNFKQLYERVYREQQRTDKHVAVALVELRTEKHLERKMEILKEVIESKLRKSDIYTKLNSNEYLFLFVVKDDFDIYTIMSKLQASFYLKCRRNEVRFHFYSRSMEEIQGENN